MDGEMMARQVALPLEIPKTVAVVGCGGVGSWVAFTLAMAGVPELYLFDMDVLELHNLNRIPAMKKDVGRYKTDAVKKAIQLFRPDCKIHCMGMFSREEAETLGLGMKLNWMVCTTDSLASRKECHAWAEYQGVPYVEAGAEGEYGSATGKPPTFFTPVENDPGYASVPVWIGPCLSAANVACAYVLHNRAMEDKVVRMGWGGGWFDVFTNAQPKEAESVNAA